MGSKWRQRTRSIDIWVCNWVILLLWGSYLDFETSFWGSEIFGAKFQISGATAVGRKFPDNRSIYPTVAKPPGGRRTLSQWLAEAHLYIAQIMFAQSALQLYATEIAQSTEHLYIAQQKLHRSTLLGAVGCKRIRDQRLVLPGRVFMRTPHLSFQNHPVPGTYPT